MHESVKAKNPNIQEAKLPLGLNVLDKVAEAKQEVQDAELGELVEYLELKEEN